MKQKNITIIFLILVFASLYSEQYNSGGLLSFSITDDSICFSNDAALSGLPDKIEIKNYKIINIGKLSFVIDSNGTKQMLLLRNNEIISVYLNSGEIFFGINTNISKNIEGIPGVGNSFTVSSFLTENNKKYLPKYFGEPILDLPWIEGVFGYGIGETITFKMTNVQGLYLFNGFVSFDKPDLYDKNSRIKTVNIKDNNTNKSTILTLLDSPNPQLIMLPEMRNHEIEIKIVDVYKGSIYQDTCLAGILLTEK